MGFVLLSEGLHDAGTRWDGSRRDQARRAALQAIIIGDSSGRLRRVSCIAGNENRQPLNAHDLEFLYGCAMSVSIAEQRDALKRWLEDNLPNKASDASTPGTDLPQLDATVSGVRVVVRWAPGLIDLTLTRAH